MLVKIEIVYTTAKVQKKYVVICSPFTTVKEAIIQSNLLIDFPTINLSSQKIGIYSEIVPLNFKIKDGDRIEIYRPLILDPKEARRLRVEYNRKKEGG